MDLYGMPCNMLDDIVHIACAYHGTFLPGYISVADTRFMNEKADEAVVRWPDWCISCGRIGCGSMVWVVTFATRVEM